jgi:ATP-dependent DNA helicase RecG
MMSKEEVYLLLNKLDSYIADDLESQKLDFKQWNKKILS